MGRRFTLPDDRCSIYGKKLIASLIARLFPSGYNNCPGLVMSSAACMQPWHRQRGLDSFDTVGYEQRIVRGVCRLYYLIQIDLPDQHRVHLQAENKEKVER